MALIHEVFGAMTIQVKTINLTSWSTIGVTPAREMPDFSEEWLGQEIGSNESGDEPEEIIYTGRRGVLSFILAKIDSTNFPIFVADLSPGNDTGAETEGQMGVIGSLWIGAAYATGYLFQVRFLSAHSGKVRGDLQFGGCYMLGPQSMRRFGYGHDHTRYAITCHAKRRNDTIGTFAQTDDLLVVADVS